MYKKTELKNGLRIVTNESKDRNSVSLGFWVGVGGRYEEVKTNGATHFLEHIVFKGSQYYSCDQIKEQIEGVGGALNAFTSEEQTCFYAKIPYQFFDQTFDTLADMVFFPKIPSKEVEKEKGVIVEEIKMYHDLPQYYVIELLDSLIWPNHPVGKGIAGTIDSVLGLSAKDLKHFHESYYKPNNIVIAASGRVSHERLAKLARKKLNHSATNGSYEYKPVDAPQTEPKVKFFKKDIEQMHLAFGIPGLDENHKDRYVLSLLNVIFGGNMSSRLFVEVREKKGLAYSIGSASKCLHDTGVFLIRAGVDNQKIVQTVEVILKELTKIKKSNVTASEFKRAKDYFKGQLQLGLEDTMEHMLWIGEAMITKNKTRSLQTVLKELDKITIKDLRRVANEVMQESRYNLAVVGPITDQQQAQLSALLKVF